MKSFVFSALLFSILFGSCRKDDCQDADRSAPRIKLASPASRSTVAVASAVPVSFSVTDNVNLANIRFAVVHSATGALVVGETVRPESPGFGFSKTYRLPEAGTYRLQVEATDGSGNRATAAVVVEAE